MSWVRSESGHYTRELSSREYLSCLIGSAFRDRNLEDWFIHAAVIVDAPLSSLDDELVRLRNAWQQLRFEYPGIAVELTDNAERMIYKPCALESERASWLAESFSVNEVATSTNDIYGTLQTKPSSYLCVAPKAKAIVLCVQHWHGDGRGVLCLLGRLLTIIDEGPKEIASLQWGTEGQRLPLSVDFRTQISPDIAPEHRGEVREAAHAFLMVSSVRGLKAQGDLSAPCQASQLETLVLSHSRSEAIVEACKHKGLSVTAVFHAAACLENIKHGVGSLDKPYTATVRRDLRVFLGESKPRIGDTADTLMASSSFTKIDPHLSFFDFARALQHHYKSGYSEGYFKTYDAALCAEVLRLMLSGELAGLDHALEIQFSSLGKLDAFFPNTFRNNSAKSERVRSLEFGLTTYTPGISGMWLYFFDGQIYMSIVYNTAYRTSEAVLGFLSTLEDAIVRELAL